MLPQLWDTLQVVLSLIAYLIPVDVVHPLVDDDDEAPVGAEVVGQVGVPGVEAAAPVIIWSYTQYVL